MKMAKCCKLLNIEVKIRSSSTLNYVQFLIMYIGLMKPDAKCSKKLIDNFNSKTRSRNSFILFFSVGKRNSSELIEILRWTKKKSFSHCAQIKRIYRSNIKFNFSRLLRSKNCLWKCQFWLSLFNLRNFNILHSLHWIAFAMKIKMKIPFTFDDGQFWIETKIPCELCTVQCSQLNLLKLSNF